MKKLIALVLLFPVVALSQVAPYVKNAFDTNAAPIAVDDIRGAINGTTGTGDLVFAEDPTFTGSLHVLGLITAPGIAITNFPGPGFLYISSAQGGDGQIQPGSEGPGIDLDGGTISVETDTIPGGTNFNDFNFPQMSFGRPPRYSSVATTTNILLLDLSTGPSVTDVIVTNSTLSIAFANVPADTDSLKGPFTVVATNATTSDASVSANFASGRWIELHPPIAVATNVTFLYFYTYKGMVFGTANGPSLTSGQYSRATFTASSAVTNFIANFGSARAGISGLANVFLPFSTNRPTVTTIETELVITIRNNAATNITLGWNSSWKEIGNTTNMNTITNGTAYILSLKVDGTAETDVYAVGNYSQ